MHNFMLMNHDKLYVNIAMINLRELVLNRAGPGGRGEGGQKKLVVEHSGVGTWDLSY